MATTASTAAPDALRTAREGYPAGSVRFDVAMIGVSAWLIGGLFVDGWAHFHGMVDDSFFTPWHAIFYSGFMAVAAFLGINQWRNISRGYAFWRALPEGYALSLVGAAIFAVGGVGDLIWHTLFGIELGTEALLSPTHLLLATGMALISSGPLRAAWHRLPAGQGGWRTLTPMLLSATLLGAVLAFFTAYAHPFIETFATEPSVGSSAEEGESGVELYVMNADGSAQTRLTMTPGMYGWSGAWSPDGSQIVLTMGDTAQENGQSDIYVMNADGGGLTRLTNLEGEEYTASWSPDGTQLAFVSRSGETSNVYVMNADGSGRTQLTESAGHKFWPVWSHDGTQMIFTLADGNNIQIYRMNPDGSDPTLVMMEGENGTASWSPDGSRIVFNSNRAGTWDLYMMDAECLSLPEACGSEPTRLTESEDFEGNPSWSPDGEQIIFTLWQGENAEVYQMNADGRELTNLSQNPALDDDNASWSPDGSKILYTGGWQTSGGGNQEHPMSLGISSILIQSALTMGLVLLIARRWALPFGALTLVFTLTTGLISVLTDQYVLVLAALVGGLLADVLVRWLKPWSASPERYHLFGFLVPALLYAIYFAVLQLTDTIGWTIHVWAGAIFLAGAVGLLISVLVTWAQQSAPPQGAASAA